MTEAVITIRGNVASDVSIRITGSGVPVASFRLACNGRRYDSRARSWVDDDPSFYTVCCWKSPLADNVDASLRKGDPVVVHGRIKSTQWRGKDNVLHSGAEIDARSLGHDLFRGTSAFTKVSRVVAPSEEKDVLDSIREEYLSTHGTDAAVMDPRSAEMFDLGELSSQRPDAEAGGESRAGAVPEPATV